jgi:hypothetical protein
MGLIQAIADEIISFPKQTDFAVSGENKMFGINRVGFSILNLIFQSIDCVFVPFAAYLLLFDQIQVGLFKWFIIVLCFATTFFSWLQFIYYFIAPTEKYVSPFSGRIFGETAIGGLIAALFKIKIYTYIK